MKLGTLKEGGRDGTLVVVAKNLSYFVRAEGIAATMQSALDNWDTVQPALQDLYTKINSGEIKGTPFNASLFAAPLPRAYQFADGSAYMNHVELVRKSRGSEVPASLLTDPLVYQGVSDSFLGATDDVLVESEDFGIDFEAEIAVITGDTPMAVKPENALKYVRLIAIINDVSLRRLVPAELEKGFGFFVAKPASSFAPVVVTPDEFGDKWSNGRFHYKLVTHLNGELYGSPDAGTDMHFGFHQLISHVAKTRKLTAGCIIGSGTVSNRDRNVGSSCLVEKRMLETLEHGKATTQFMKFGDRVKIEALDESGESIFGAIDQKITKYTAYT